MKPLKTKIREHAAQKQAQWHIVEKDYALSYILAGIASEPLLSRTLVFKGGTALKKCYFGDYRFSEDLDFSSISTFMNETLEESLKRAMYISETLLKNFGEFEIKYSKKPEKAAHPNDQRAFVIQIKFPEHNRFGLCNIKLEITQDEPVILNPVPMPLIHGYQEDLNVKVNCYDIHEILAEKLRALLQTHENLTTRGWNRPRARDYFDLWNILKYYGGSITPSKLSEVLNLKCEHRNVKYSRIDDFFTRELINETEKHWESSLHLQVNHLPSCEVVLNETRTLINRTVFSE